MTLSLLLPPNGMVLVTPAAVTPGSARIRRSASLVNPTQLVVVVVARARQAWRTTVSTLSRLKPGSTASTWRKLANSRPAPISSTNAKATCVTTSPRRSVRAPRPAVPPASLFAQHDGQVRRQHVGDRNQPEDDADHRGDAEAVGHDHAVEMNLAAARQLLNVQRAEQLKRAVADRQTRAADSSVSSTLSVTS